jgi:hypothetical protein
VFDDTIWHPELIECLGDLRPRDGEPIDLLIQTVSFPEQTLFGPRCEAMRSLGKIGAPAGVRAARGIRATIYDSEPWVVALRERVLARIETPEEMWTGCSRCYWGRVPGDGECSTCLGLGFMTVE